MPLNLRRLSRWLRRHYPTRHRVTIRVYDANRLSQLYGPVHGFVQIGEDCATIRLASGPPAMMAETLLEEYAHVVRHETPVPVTQEHDSIFWAILGTITMQYRGGDD